MRFLSALTNVNIFIMSADKSAGRDTFLQAQFNNLDLVRISSFIQTSPK